MHRHVIQLRSAVLFAASLCLFGLPQRSLAAITEYFELYSPPQVAAMGNAITADATGYLANYYNPAGLAKNPRSRKEYLPVDLVSTLGFSALGSTLSAKSFGIYRLLDTLKASPNSYNYFNFASAPSISFRNFCLSFLGNYRFAGISDGTNVEMNNVADVGATFGFGTNFASNFFKFGVTGKVFLRNELKGTFAHSALGSDDEIQSKMTEGIGYGFDVGGMVTLPMKYLPAFGVVWKDALGTRFTQTNFFNGLATGAPETIASTVNMAISIHPVLAKKVKSTFAFEVKHIFRDDLTLLQKMHFGFQLEDMRSWYVWAGANQTLNPTFGIGLRLPGGALELASYAQVYDGTNSDRRLMLRYTIGWQ